MFICNFTLSKGLKCPSPGGIPCIHSPDPLGAGFSKSSTAASAARKKRTNPGLAVSLKDVCFPCCYYKQFAVSVVITEAMLGSRFRRWNLLRSSASKRRVRRLALRSQIASLHRVFAAAILTVCSSMKRHRFVECGRPSSAVLAFEYGLMPRAKRRTMG
jgi:hypothetical protein